MQSKARAHSSLEEWSLPRYSGAYIVSIFHLPNSSQLLSLRTFTSKATTRRKNASTGKHFYETFHTSTHIVALATCIAHITTFNVLMTSSFFNISGTGPKSYLANVSTIHWTDSLKQSLSVSNTAKQQGPRLVNKTFDSAKMPPICQKIGPQVHRNCQQGPSSKFTLLNQEANSFSQSFRVHKHPPLFQHLTICLNYLA